MLKLSFKKIPKKLLKSESRNVIDRRMNTRTLKHNTRWKCHVVFRKGTYFVTALFQVRKLTFLRLYPTNFHKTKCITYVDMSTFHKHTACLNPACSICKYLKQM